MTRPIIPTDSDSIYTVIDSLTSLQQRAIVRPDNPPPGIAGFLFDIQGEEELDLRSEITDHYTEANSAIQDHIGLAPEEFTVKGLVAEIYSVPPAPDSVEQAPDALPTLSALQPTLSATATSQLATINTQSTGSQSSASTSKSLYDFYTRQTATKPAQTRQASAFGYFYQLWKGRERFTVETPYGVLTNMAIVSIRGTQDAKTIYESQLSVKFKKIRVVGTVSSTLGQLAGRAVFQTAPITDNGQAGTTDVPASQKTSMLYQLGQLIGVN